MEELLLFPGQVSELVKSIEPSKRTQISDGAWSIQEHVGHLLAMESLWIARLDNFELNHEVLRPWNGHNNDVRAARFNEQSIQALCRDLSDIRTAFVEFVGEMSDIAWQRRIYHERLQIHFMLKDHLAFIVEHDQHHLKTIQNLMHA